MRVAVRWAGRRAQTGRRRFRRPAGVAVLAVAAVMGMVAPAPEATAQSSALPAWGWGWNIYGEVGDGTTTSPVTSPDTVERGAIPTGATLTEVAAGRTSSLGLDSAGRAYGWGDNSLGQLGNGSTAITVTSPVAVSMPAGRVFTALAAGVSHSLALDSTGQVWSWGDNTNGQLGDGTTTSRLAPVAVTIAGRTITSIAAGGDHSLALDSTGQVWSWGDNTYGQAGDGSLTTPVLSPVMVQQAEMPSGIAAIAAGQWHSLALDLAGHLWAWGDDAFGQLGSGSFSVTPVTAPQPVTLGAMPEGTIVRAITAGQIHNLVLDSANHLWSWGDNTYGQLGDGTTTARPAPVAVSPGAIPAGTTIDRIAAGELHNLVLDSTGKVWAWGRNDFGQVGNGTTTSPVTTPVAVVQGEIPPGTRIVRVAGGGYHSLALAAARTSSSTSVGVSANPVQAGQNVTITATVTCGQFVPTGTVTFYDGNTSLGQATLSGGQASITTNSLAVGTHQITARYSGDANCDGASSPVVLLVVRAACQTISGIYPGPLWVTTPICLAPGTWVQGPVSISGQGSLTATGVVISGPLTAYGGTGLRVCGSTVQGLIGLTGMTGSIVIGDAVAGCAPNTVRGSMSIIGNPATIAVGGNLIAGTATLNNNIAPGPAAVIAGNTIQGYLTCTGNVPPPVNNGRPNTVVSFRAGQCAAL
jgi:alpha-tubulin suppressor-like RCC1 family protein